MAQRIDASGLNLEERIIDIWRCAAVVKGGRRFSFAAMVVVGNGNGILGLGYGKAREVPTAIEKAVKDAKKELVSIPVYGTTVPHEVRGRYRSSQVVLIPAYPGTGLIAGQVSRAMLESIGVHDVLSKSVGGNNNPRNLAKATLDALQQLRNRDLVAKLRGVELGEDPLLASSLKAQPQHRQRLSNQQEENRGRERRGGEGGRGRRGRGQGEGDSHGGTRGAAAPVSGAASADAGSGGAAKA